MSSMNIRAFKFPFKYISDTLTEVIVMSGQTPEKGDKGMYASHVTFMVRLCTTRKHQCSITPYTSR